MKNKSSIAELEKEEIIPKKCWIISINSRLKKARLVSKVVYEGMIYLMEEQKGEILVV